MDVSKNWHQPSYRTLAARGTELRRTPLRQCVSAGEALPAATRAQWREATGIEIIDGIGATEMIHIFISSPPEAVRRGAIGQVVPGYRARIVGDDGQPLPPGAVGRLAVKGPTGCRYLADVRQSQYVQDGWNLTGDAFSMDADGYFFYQARTDDMIVSAGYNIAGPEVESALLAHPAVAECGVVGVPDEERGQIVKAVVVLREGQVHFNAVWCGPCKKLKPIVYKLAEKYNGKMEVLAIDVDKENVLANQMNITGIPLLILYKSGKEVWRNMGLIGEKELEAIIEAN